jgi:dTDP-4-amino-4,6-dideoxygalactose transaminase
VPTVAAIEAVGAVPVLADVDPDTYTLDPDQLADLLTARTKALLPVHLYGHPCDMQAVSAFAKQHRLAVVEDCAQAHGAMLDGKKVGGFSDIGCFSLFPTKNLGGIGDGGIVVTNDSTLADKLRRLRQYGWDQPQHSLHAGVCSRLDELQAAILRVKLRHLDTEIERRREIAVRYDRALGSLPLKVPVVLAECGHAYHLYVVQSSRREALRDFLGEREIAARIHYPQPVHTQPAYAGRLTTGKMTVTGQIAPLILSLPLYPQMTDEDVEAVITAVLEFHG